MCRVSDDGGAKVWNTEHRVARKDHRCGECFRTIMAGEPYEYHHYVSEDGWCGEHKVCSHCAVLGNWIQIECGGTICGELIEDIEEHATEYNRTDLAALASMARGHWKWADSPSGYLGVPIPPLPAPLTPSAEPKP